MLKIPYRPHNQKVKCWDGKVVEIRDPSDFVAGVMLRCQRNWNPTYECANAVLAELGRTERFGQPVKADEKEPQLPPVGWFLVLFRRMREQLNQLESNPAMILAGTMEPSYVPLAEQVELPDGKTKEIRDIVEFYAKINGPTDGAMYYDHGWADSVRLELGQPVVQNNPESAAAALSPGWCVGLMLAIRKRIAEIVEEKKE